jgi:hypothetical protein
MNWPNAAAMLPTGIVAVSVSVAVPTTVTVSPTGVPARQGSNVRATGREVECLESVARRHLRK